MKIAIITDIHLGKESTNGEVVLKLSRFAQTELDNFINKVKENPQIEAVINLGDLIEDENYHQDATNYQKAIKNFKDIQKPVYHTIGNHEQVFLGDEDLRAWLGYEHLFFSFKLGCYLGIILYSEHKPGILPRIGISQIKWLKNELARTNLPVIVFVHHPLSDQSLIGNVWFENNNEACLIENRVEVRTILEASGKVKAVINGHAHWYNLTTHNGIPYITFQSLVENIGNNTPAASWSILELEDGEVKFEIVEEKDFKRH